MLKLVFSKRVMATVVLCISYFGVVASDEIYLSNGDRITGDITQLVDGNLGVKTSYAGVINIRWSEVKFLKSEKTVYIGVDKETIKGVISVEDGVVILDSDNKDKREVKSGLVQFIFLKKPSITKKSGRIDMGFSNTSGNTETLKTRLDGEVSYRKGENRFVLGFLLNQGEAEGVKNENNSLSRFKYDRFLTEKWYTFLALSMEEDEFKDINLRSTVGLGLGRQFIDSSLTQLSVEISGNYVSSDFINENDTDYSASSWTLNFHRKLPSWRARIFHRNSGVIGITEDDKLFIRSQTGLRFPIRKNLSATGQFDIDWDKTPATGRDSMDRKTVFSIGYRW